MPPLRRRPILFRAGRAFVGVLAACALMSGAAAHAETATPEEPAPEKLIPDELTPKVLNLDEAAVLLRVTPWVLEDMAWLEQIPGRYIGGEWRFNRRALMRWLAGENPVTDIAQEPAHDPAPLESVDVAEPAEAAPQSEGTVALGPDTMSEIVGMGTNGEGQEPKPIGEAPERPTADEVFLRDQSVLLDEGDVTLELGLFYVREDDQQLVIVQNGGTQTLALGRSEEETFATTFTGRYGLFDGTELFAGIPLRSTDSTLVVGSLELSDSRTEFDDVSAGIRQTILPESSGWPELLVTLEGRMPTGSSSYAVGGGLAAVRTIDPVALFANANYLRTFSRDFNDVTRLEAEDRVDATVGYALALNDTLTISTALSGVFTGESTFPNATLRGQELLSLQFGLTSFLTEGLFIEPTVSFGLNETDDSVVVGVSLPYTFEP